MRHGLLKLASLILAASSSWLAGCEKKAGPAPAVSPGDVTDDYAAVYVEYDVDQDGFGEPEDCDDLDREINPRAAEICDDGRDNNCDGAIDGADESCR